MLQTCKEKSLEVLFWRLTQDSKLVVAAKIEIIRRSRNELVVAMQPDQEIQIKEVIGSRDFVDVYVPDSGLLMRCSVKSSEEQKKFVLQVPSSAALMERRSQPRINVFDSGEVNVVFSKGSEGLRSLTQSFNKACFDISSGGFSFLIYRLETKFFQIHGPIRNIQVTIPGHSFKASAEITLIKEVDPHQVSSLSYKAWRVCCKFNQIDDISRRLLERYIFERLQEDLHAINS